MPVRDVMRIRVVRTGRLFGVIACPDLVRVLTVSARSADATPPMDDALVRRTLPSQLDSRPRWQAIQVDGVADLHLRASLKPCGQGYAEQPRHAPPRRLPQRRQGLVTCPALPASNDHKPSQPRPRHVRHHDL